MKVYLAIAILCVFIAGCADSDSTKIGIMTITSGDLAFLGNNIVYSAELAAEGHNIEFIVEDVGGLGTGGEAVAAYRKLVDVDGVEIIINGMTSDATLAVAHLFDEDKVVVLDPLAEGEQVDNAAEYLFRNGPSDILASVTAAKDFEEFGFERVGLYVDNAEWSLDMAKQFRKHFGGEIVVDEIVTPDKTDYRTELLKLGDVDAVFLMTATGTSSNYMIKQLDEMGFDEPVFTNFIGFNAHTHAVAGDAIEGVYVYTPEFDEAKAEGFFLAYEVEYGASPSIPFHATGTYDAVMMAVEAIDAVGYDGELIHDYLLEHIQNWEGLNGVVSFDEKGNTQTGFVLTQVVNGSLVAVE